MFEGYIEKILQRKLGRYIDGIDKHNFKVGVSSSVNHLKIDYRWERPSGEFGTTEGHILAP